MSVSSLKRSGLKTGQKYNDAMAGNPKFAWLDTTNWTSQTARASSYFSSSVNTSRLMVFNNKGQGLCVNGGPGNVPGVTDYGASPVSQFNLGYSNYNGAFNGWFIGSGNYITSAIGYKQNSYDGWTLITGYSSYTGSGGAGNGGFTSAGVPVWLIPVTTSAIPVGVLSTTTMPNTSWTANTVSGTSGSSGYRNKVVLANDVVVYAYHSSSTESAANLTIKYAAVTPGTGAISTTWNTGSLDFAATGVLLALEAVNGVFVLTTVTGDRYSSTNGATWTRRTTGTSGTTTNAMQLTSGETGYMIGFGYNTTNAYGVNYSTDGITFTSMSTFSPFIGDHAAIGVGKGIRFVQTNSTGWWKQP